MCPLCVSLINFIVMVELCWLYTGPGNVVHDACTYFEELCLQFCYDIPFFVGQSHLSSYQSFLLAVCTCLAVTAVLFIPTAVLWL